MDALMNGTMLALDVTVIAALGLALWRFGRDPSAGWDAREARLRELVEGLQALVQETDAQARAIDTRLACHVDELRQALESGAAPAAAPAPGRTGALRRQIQELVASATPIEEIARRVDMPVSEVRLLVGLQGGRGGKKVTAKTAA